MSGTLACIAGEEIYNQLDAGEIQAQALGPQSTPFGDSGNVFSVTGGDTPFFMLARNRADTQKTSPSRINCRADMYALKNLGADCVLGWGSGRAITHSITTGDLVILSDVIDLMTQRKKTFFEDSPLGAIRQFPVFCTCLRRLAGEVLQEMELLHHNNGTAVVMDGPRLSTPAEVRMFTAIGAEIITNTFCPEVFLAKELQMGYVGVCYVVNYAETGSRYETFNAAGLFDGIIEKSGSDRLACATGALSKFTADLAGLLAKTSSDECSCKSTMARNIQRYNLSENWREWFKNPGNL